jgi:predicted exporter
LPALLARPSRRDPERAVAIPQRLLVWWRENMSRRACVFLALVLIALSIPGWVWLQSNDDVHLLVARPAALVAQEEQIRELTGFGSSGLFFLVEGMTPDAVLQHEEGLTARLAALAAQGEIAGFQGISSFVPSAARQAKNHALWRDRVFADEAALTGFLSDAGLRDDIATQQIAAFKASRGIPLTLDEWLHSPLSSPLRHLWLGSTAHGYAAVVVPQGVRDTARLSAAAAGLPGITPVDKAASVTRLFRDYRQWGALWLLGALCLVYGVLCVRYRWRQAAVVLAPTLLAMILALGVFGWVGTPLNLFNLMGLMLVLGVGVNYAIFLREGGVRAAATLAGVLLSAGTTLLSFGLLSFSSMPVLSSFGLTLLVGVSIAVLLAPIVLSFEPKAAA